MSTRRLVVLAGLLALAGCRGNGADSFGLARPLGAAGDEVRFRPLRIVLEVGERPVAAYQVELRALSGDAEIVGVEGGDAGGFTDPPYYDPAALAGGRIVLAALSRDSVLEAGRHHVATVHMREVGPQPRYELHVVTAGGADARPVELGAVLVDEPRRSPEEEP